MRIKSYLASATAAALLLVVSLGWCYAFRSGELFWLGTIGAGFAALRLASRWIQTRRSRRTAKNHAAPAAPHREPRAKRVRGEPVTELSSLVEQMLSDGRYTLLLRPQIAGDLTPELYQRAIQMLEDEMALVPTGDVGLALQDASDFDPSRPELDLGAHEVVIRVESLYIDRYPVTNEQYQSFVDASGYEQSSIWHPEILPAVLDFVDASGQPGPRLWRDGRYLPGQSKHPVVGISWYEANAYSRWVGKRLATDAEWVKAGSWPVSLGGNTRRQRRFPWGQTMDRERANLWSSGIEGTVSVEEFAEGVSVGGVYQLIGNVWEWTSGDFTPAFEGSFDNDDQDAMKNIRGGAFDTYFESQASCQFASGEHPLQRKHNIGFRCALGMCDLTLNRDESSCNAGTFDREESLESQEVTV